MADWRHEIRRRLAGSHLPPARELEITDELSQHLADREASLLARGVAPDEARRLVLDEIAEHELMRRDFQRLAPPPALDPPGAPAGRGLSPRHVAQDLRYALRTLRRDRGYTVTAVLALAIGIGGAAAIFGAIDAVLLRPMPFPHADRLVVPVSENLARDIDMGSTSFADYMDWREQKDIFEAVALWRTTSLDVTGDGEPERVDAAVVAEEYFRVIEVKPVRGRLLQPADHQAGAPAVVMLSHAFWQSRFGGREVTGQKLIGGGVPYEIIGVLPPRAIWPDSMQVFFPARPSTYNDDVRTRRDNMIFQNIARLRDGVTLEQADARVATIAARVEHDNPNSRKGWTNRLVPLREYIVAADVSRALFVLLGAVGSVLLIVCANVANLALVRGQSRARELAIRLSLGASRSRLVQQLVTESTVLAVAGASLGAAIAVFAMRGLAAMAPPDTPFVDTMRFDGRVLLATTIVAAFAVIAAGLLPALVTSGLRLGARLREGAAGSGVSARAARLRHGFVVVEIAAAVVLLVLSSLLLRSFGRLTSVDSGTDVDRVLSGRISLPGARYPDNGKRTAFYRDLVARLREDPNVEFAAAASFVPVGTGGFGLGRVFLAEGQPEPPASSDVGASWTVITPDYFRTTGVELRSGRHFTDDDREDTTPVMIVSESFARKMFGDRSPLGKRVRSWRDENIYREVVGVVSDVRYEGLSDKPAPQMYVPHSQSSWGAMLVVVRARHGDPTNLAPALRKAVASLDNQLAVARVTTMAEAAGASVAAQRYAALLVGVLASLAIVLAALGVYGVISYVFVLRRREIGIRLALGASVSSVYRLVFRYGFTLTAIGLAIGCAAAVAASRWLAALLYETSAADGSAWAAMLIAISIAAAIACFAPARRSARADPVKVLRSE